MEKTNAGESELHNLGGALAALRGLGIQGAGAWRRLPQPLFPNPETENAHISAPSLEPLMRSRPRYSMGKVEVAASAAFSDA